jgi:hypothetical protein
MYSVEGRRRSTWARAMTSLRAMFHRASLMARFPALYADG